MYKQKYELECQFLWENFIPRTGKSDILQAELIRLIEKLRHEAQYNLNCHWNEEFESDCEFLKTYLKSNQAINSISLFESKGKYAREYYDGYKAMDVDSMAYVEDDLYDMLLDEVIEQFYIERELIKF